MSDPNAPATHQGLPIDKNGMTAKDRWNYAQRCRRAERMGLPLPDPPYGIRFSTESDASAFGLSVTPLPDEDIPAHEIIARRKADFRRKRNYEDERRLIRAAITIPGPIGIIHLGDPHVDDQGTDWETLESHIRLIQRTDGLFAANVGDMTNNWVGRLAKLHSLQSVTARQAWKLAEWLIGELAGKWVYMIGGNHDAWSGEGDPLNWIARQAGAMYEASEARVQITFPAGAPVVVNARHDFKGSSQWNPAHGPMKAAQLGIRDDIMICGHYHKSGYSPLKDPDSGRVCHCIQVSSYKVYDRYAREKGFRDQSLSPCVMTVVDPTAQLAVNRVQVFWDPFRGTEYLKFLRDKWRTK